MNETAKALHTDEGLGEEENQYLTFRLAQEMFAINILSIREIMEYGNITTVPMMPAFVRGVINLRGAVVPVIDLVCRFGRGQCAINRRSCIVILELAFDNHETREVGVIVDEVSEVREIAATDIEPPPTFGTRIRTDFTAGMGKVEGHFVIVLDVQRVVDVEEMAALADIAG